MIRGFSRLYGLFVLVPTVLGAQAPGTAFIAGRVSVRSDTGRTSPASGASVSVVGSPIGAITSDDGRYRLEQVPPGAVTLRARLLGYRTLERAVRVRAGDTLRVDFTLESEAQILSPVRTSALKRDR